MRDQFEHRPIRIHELLKHEAQVSILNVSGDPNIGKTFACAMALKLIGAPDLMLSKATPSALLDHAHIFNNMLLVWDDPRDVSQSQLTSMIHEAFHGLPNSSVTKGNRSYHSNIIIGTQNKLIGLPHTQEHAPTFSRLSHVDMNQVTYTPKHTYEQDLKQFLLKYDINSFGTLLQHKIDFKHIDKLHHILLQQPDAKHILPRAIRIIAIDWYFAQQFNKLTHIHTDLHTYFTQQQITFTHKYANNHDIAFNTLINTLKIHIHNKNTPKHIFTYIHNKTHVAFHTHFLKYIQIPQLHNTIQTLKHQTKYNKLVQYKNVKFTHKVKKAYTLHYKLLQ